MQCILSEYDAPTPTTDPILSTMEPVRLAGTALTDTLVQLPVSTEPPVTGLPAVPPSKSAEIFVSCLLAAPYSTLALTMLWKKKPVLRFVPSHLPVGTDVASPFCVMKYSAVALIAVANPLMEALQLDK